MKNKALKLLSAFAIAVLGVSIFANVSRNVKEVDAAQHINNYADYTYTGSYYSTLNTSGTDGMTGTFRTALRDYVYPAGWVTYSGGSGNINYLSGALQYADEDPTNSSNMVYFYTRDSVTKNAASTWNREHVWPQSLSGTDTDHRNWGTDKAGTDILHLRPTYNDTNSERGNKVYADLSKTGAVTYSGMTYGYISGNRF